MTGAMTTKHCTRNTESWKKCWTRTNVPANATMMRDRRAIKTAAAKELQLNSRALAAESPEFFEPVCCLSAFSLSASAVRCAIMNSSPQAITPDSAYFPQSGILFTVCPFLTARAETPLLFRTHSSSVDN